MHHFNNTSFNPIRRYALFQKVLSLPKVRAMTNYYITNKIQTVYPHKYKVICPHPIEYGPEPLRDKLRRWKYIFVHDWLPYIPGSIALGLNLYWFVYFVLILLKQ